MSLFRLYVRKQQVVIPTVAETEAGFYLDCAPVEIFPVGDVPALKMHIAKLLCEGNIVIATPDGSDEPGSAILDKLHLQKWSSFETTAIRYTVHSTARYIKIYRTGKDENGRWNNDADGLRVFDGRTPVSMMVDQIVQDIIRQPEGATPGTQLMRLTS